MAHNTSQAALKTLKRVYAEKTRRTIFFLGAGASAESGLPTWFDLREGLHEKVNGTIDSAVADAQELENFRQLEDLREKDDYWGYFEHAENCWPTTYTDHLEETFNLDFQIIETPIVYKRIWEMKEARQVVTLNVDGLLSRAFYETHSAAHSTLLEYDGYSVTDSQSFFSRGNYCLLSLHGTASQKSRWVMNGSERRRLTEGDSKNKYHAFLTWLFQSHNIVFVGINPRDISISYAIQRASGTGLLGKHFWICPSPNQETRRWAESNSIRLIAYEPEILADGSVAHSSDLCAILDSLDRHISEDPPVELPFMSDPLEREFLGQPGELVKLFGEDRALAIRKLSGAATKVGADCGFVSPQMDSFVKDYILPVQLATSLDAKTPPFNRIANYGLIDKIQSGGSSAVWLCEALEKRNLYAVAKVLNGNRHEDSTERQSFRRGIESMYLLKDLELRVAPEYFGHLELPLVAFMEHIPGATLDEVIAETEIGNPFDLLKLFEMICKAVRSCHLSDGQVLHRDLKPGNIIFRNWFNGYDISDLIASEIRLINFDLSWHRFTSGNSKAISADDAGYYAPEHKGAKNAPPPRSAETDVYMLGMVLFFLLAESPPPEGGARLSDWEQVVSKQVNRRFDSRIIRNRIRRLILSMTAINMNDRPDIEAALAEISNIFHFNSDTYLKVDHDFLVENILAEIGRGYEWNAEKMEGRVQSIPQANLYVRYIPKGMSCEIEFYRSRDDGSKRSSFGQKINARIQNARQTLTDAGWQCDLEGGVIKSLKARINLLELAGKSDLGAKEIQVISNHLLSSIE